MAFRNKNLQTECLTIAEASELINFFNRKELESRDFNGNHYTSKEWKYLTTGDLILQERFCDNISSCNVGCDAYSLQQTENELEITKLLPYELNISIQNELFENRESTTQNKSYNKTKYVSSMHFWPLVYKFGFDKLGEDILKSIEKRNKEGRETKKFRAIKIPDSGGVFLEKNDLIKAFSEWYGKEIGQKSSELLHERKIGDRKGIYTTISKNVLSKYRKFSAKIISLSLGITRQGDLNLSIPKSCDWLYLQHNILEGLEKALIEEEVEPKNLGNGVIVMNEDRIPKYLQRKLGLKGEK